MKGEGELKYFREGNQGDVGSSGGGRGRVLGGARTRGY